MREVRHVRVGQSAIDERSKASFHKVWEANK